MARLSVWVLALCALCAISYAEEAEVPESLEREGLLLILLAGLNEPSTYAASVVKNNFGTFEDNIKNFKNETAARTYSEMLKEKWYLPRSVPFSVNEPAHAFEAMTLFNVLYSAKDFETFHNTVAFLRDTINERLFTYTVRITVIYRQDTFGLVLPPIYETFPSLFLNAEIIATAARINVHADRLVDYYPSTYKSADGVVIKANATYWANVNNKNFALTYFTEDVDLSAAQYFLALVNPFWLGGSNPPIVYKERRGEAWWFAHRQLVARYYMERLSNGLGEIPDIGLSMEEGFTSGLVYSNGVPLPSRPDNFQLYQPQLSGAIEKVLEFERRIWETVDKGFYVNRKGEQVSLLNENGLNVLGNLIESNADSPNRYYYKDFIRLWKQILGNNVKSNYEYESKFTPLVVPSALENFETSLRDPAFYSLWKRILNLFVQWQKQMHLYKPDELIAAGVEIEKVEVDKLETFFETTLLNITSNLYAREAGHKSSGKNIVLVEQERLNHKPFNVKIGVKSDAAKKVLVKLFLAPKYDSKGLEIPLHFNTENFFLLEQFYYDLPGGESVISRKSSEFHYTAKSSPNTATLVEEILSRKWKPQNFSVSVFPDNLLLPKGTAGGQTFQFVAYIQDLTTFHPAAFPVDRPLHSYQLYQVKNIMFKDVKIYHQE